MVTLLTAVLGISIVGMATILGLKRYELNTGRVLFASARPRLRAFFRGGFFWAERVLPNLVAHESGRAWGMVRAAARTALARGILTIEQWLEQGLRSLRQLSHAPARGGEASPFLREVAEHKKKLQEGLSEDEQQ